MNSYGSLHALKQYQHVGVQAQVTEASPHRLVQLLIDGALVRIAAARGAMEAGEVTRKGELIGKTIDIVEGLRISLDRERGGEIAANLGELYQYVCRRLLEANLRNDARIMDEVAALLREVGAGWQAIGPLVSGAAPGAGDW